MRALEFITGHVIYNPAYTYKFQLKTTIDGQRKFIKDVASVAGLNILKIIDEPFAAGTNFECFDNS